MISFGRARRTSHCMEADGAKEMSQSTSVIIPPRLFSASAARSGDPESARSTMRRAAGQVLPTAAAGSLACGALLLLRPKPPHGAAGDRMSVRERACYVLGCRCRPHPWCPRGRPQLCCLSRLPSWPAHSRRGHRRLLVGRQYWRSCCPRDRSRAADHVPGWSARRPRLAQPHGLK